MPVAADTERRLLNHYRLTSLSPDTWPHQDDSSGSDTDDDPAAVNGAHGNRRSKHVRDSSTGFRKIDPNASMPPSLSGAQKTASGADSMVQSDEQDALGMRPSVASVLRQKGLPVEENLKLRNRFMLSSTSFSPQLYLSHVHRDASTDDLLRGLDFLSRSIEQKSASLKVLVESNFEKFVRAKATIDSVYTEMKTQGVEAEDPDVTPTTRRPHSRHTSKNQSHFRTSSNPFSSAPKASQDKRKTALTKESEYGVQGIKTPLNEVTIRAEEVWGITIAGREKEDTLKSVLSALEQHREIFRVTGSIHDAIEKHDYDTVIQDYSKAKKSASEARNIASIAQANDVDLPMGDIHQIIITARMWHSVSEQIAALKRDLWKRLKESHARRLTSALAAEEQDKDVHMELMSVLLQLGVEQSPIYEYLHSRFLYLRDRIARSFERSRIEIEILRRRHAVNQQTDGKVLSKYLRSAAASASALRRFHQNSTKNMDSPAIIAFWEKVQASLVSQLSNQTGLLSEVVDFWDTSQSFIDGKAQKSFPAAVFATSTEYLELDQEQVFSLRNGAIELVNLLRDNVKGFFSDSPVEDLSELYSPIPPTPITPHNADGSGTPSSKRTFTFDPNTVPGPGPKTGSAWEKFAFWPPGANSLSGSHYLGKILVLIGSAASHMAAMSVIKQQNAHERDNFKLLVSGVRERCVQAVCAAWTQDAERVKFLETWSRNNDRRDLTNMPREFDAFEEKVIQNVQRIAYMAEAAEAGRDVDVIVPPPAKLLQALRGVFVTSLYKALSGMVENAEATNADSDGDDVGPATSAANGSHGGVAEGAMVDSNNRNVRMLMTLSNISHLRSEAIPQLITQFEASFSVKLTEESKTIRDVLGQIDARLFQTYVKPTVDSLTATITNGILSPQWVPEVARPTDARAYVYDVLLTLVMVHSEVSTTATSMTNQILSYLLEQCSSALIDAFKQREHYSLPALMQATLDVEFMAQTLNNYTTDRAGEVQSQIYLALDERTDNEARSRLQGELPEMRAVLKRLREGTKGEFGCFKKQRRGRSERQTRQQ